MLVGEPVGGHHLVVWGVKWSNAKIIKNNTWWHLCRQLADQNTTTNQKQVATTEGSMEGICDERDAWGKRDAIILGGGV